MRKILICGKTGVGKTTLAEELAPLLSATVFDGDAIRDAYPNPLGFTDHDRSLHAEFMGRLCDAVTYRGGNAIASFICPTKMTRTMFDKGPSPAFVVWIDRNGDQEFADTEAMWQDPDHWDVRVTNSGSPTYWAQYIYDIVQPAFRPTGETALFVGRYQPFHEGHKRLIEEGIRRYGQVCIGVRETSPAFPFNIVRQRIENMMREHAGRFSVIPLPNITAVCHGREVGWKVDHIDLDEATKSISATAIREQINAKP